MTLAHAICSTQTQWATPALNGAAGFRRPAHEIPKQLAFILSIVWLTRPSQSDTNKYGPNPHEVTP